MRRFYSTVLALTFIVNSGIALADGFRCEIKGEKEKAVLQIFNFTKNKTRTAAIAIFSHPGQEKGIRTAMVFKSWKGVLESQGQSKVVGRQYYDMTIDLDDNDAVEDLALFEDILGAKIWNLNRISVRINHNYGKPIKDGAAVKGTLLAWKGSNVGATFRELDCERYLKGEREVKKQVQTAQQSLQAQQTNKQDVKKAKQNLEQKKKEQKQQKQQWKKSKQAQQQKQQFVD